MEQYICFQEARFDGKGWESVCLFLIKPAALQKGPDSPSLAQYVVLCPYTKYL